MEFIGNEIQQCRRAENVDTLNPKEYHLGCHCIHNNKPCRRILWFLILDGRFNVKSNIQMIYKEVITAFSNENAKNFKDMMEKIVKKAFDEKLSQKYSFLVHKNPSYETISTITSENKCLQFGPDCIVALNGLNEILKTAFRISFALNKDLVENNASSLSQKRERYYGSLLVNKHYDYSEKSSQNYQPSPNAFQIRSDLTELLEIIFPSHNESLVEFIREFGYNDNSKAHEPTKLEFFTNRSNVEHILTLMKYSLDVSDPWIPQYYKTNISQDVHSIQPTCNLFKVWLLGERNSLRKLISSDVGLVNLQGWR